ncbi:uncharacterized protein LOC127280952 [Leptopilina boulardi]|uniref:uncharacterized protein LOC127280952 n=1 Tax=Leptopilina boulardi TaxID=63433 RepID=UPI0021F616D1|nr:uncharacterized protein LOC127280952 [Leptopilina boulardi]
MNFVIFYILLIFNIFQFIYADLDFEEKQREKSSVHLNKSKLLTKNLFELDLSTINEMEQIIHPILDEIRLLGETSRKSDKNPSECIHVSSKALLSSIDEFYNELDQCNVRDNHENNVEDAYACNEKVVSAFKFLVNGVRDYFKNCIEDL